ncbi:MAG TPA: GNAT family N-acetyltransferase [candidate division Zixibacteria bacterium]|nr:GNAT family N-acetyltransferase [candidate division Zixibacteria bacterium]
MEVRIEPMTAGDWLAVRDIYAQGIATRTATFQTEVPAWPAWDAAHLPEPRLVARDAGSGRVLGWVALSPVSDRCAYQGVAEASIYVAADARGQGIGRRLLGELLAAADRAGIWTVQVGVMAENHPSLALAERCGFRRVGVRERIGKLDGRWHDVVLLERRSPVVGTD